MICKGKARAEGGQLAAYLADYLLAHEKNERAELLELSGSQYTDLHRAIRSWEAEAAGSYCRKPLWHAQICPAPGESLTREQKREAVNILERHLGFEGQARAIVVHQKEGHEHIHVVWSRIDRATGKARRDDFSHKKNAAAAREIEERYDLRRVENPFANDQAFQSREEKRAASKARANQAEHEQERRSGLDRETRKAEITQLWQTTDCGKAFRQAVEQAGYTLARGERRGWCIVDGAGEVHSLARQIAGVRAKDVTGRMADIDLASLPDVETVRAAMWQAQQELKREGKTRRAEAQPFVQDFAYSDRPVKPQPEAKAFDPGSVIDALTRQHSTFTAASLSRYLRSHDLPDSLAAQIRTHPGLITLGPDREGKTRFTSRDMLETELRMEAAAADLASQSAHKVRDRIKHAAPSSTALNDGQKRAFDHVTEKDGLALVVGYAGTGKSTMLGAAKEAWEAQGYRVHGAALSGIAAESLEKGSGIQSRTLHSFFYRMENAERRAGALAAIDAQLAGLDPGRRKANLLGQRARMTAELESCTLGKRDVLVIDEAGMIGSRLMEKILTRAHNVGAKVVLVGDAEQLQAIDAGGAFRALQERHGAAEITEIRRQRQDWQRDATRALATGRTAEGVAQYRAVGLVHEAETHEQAKEAVIASWTKTRREQPEASQIMLAYTRVDVAGLNERARAAYRAEGRLGRDIEIETANGVQSFATGDRVYFTKNDTRLQVKNGTLATIESIDRGRVTVGVDGGRSVTFDTAEYNHITHGYAATVHKSQGVTVDRAQVLASRYMDRHATYVGLSRHRDQAELHYSREESGSFEQLSRALSRDGRKDTTLDYVRRTQEGITTPERFRRTVNQIWLAIQGMLRFPQSDGPMPERAPSLSPEPSPAKRDRLAELLGVKPDERPREDRMREHQEGISKLQQLLRRNRSNVPGLTE